MPDAALTSRPRLARVAPEQRSVGMIALGIALCTAAWWLSGVALGRDVTPLATAVACLAGAVVGLAAVGGLARRRVRQPVEHDVPPPGSIYETRAAAAQRQGRLAMMLVAGPVVLLALDRLTREGGELAGIVAGLFAAVAVVAFAESRAWARRERRDGGLRYVLVRPNALMAPLATRDIYLRALPEPDAESPFSLPL